MKTSTLLAGTRVPLLVVSMLLVGCFADPTAGHYEDLPTAASTAEPVATPPKSSCENFDYLDDPNASATYDLATTWSTAPDDEVQCVPVGTCSYGCASVAYLCFNHHVGADNAIPGYPGIASCLVPDSTVSIETFATADAGKYDVNPICCLH